MTWEAITSGGKSLIKMNRWPSPINYVKNIKILVCNEQTFLVQIDLALALFADFFWSNVVPSPRELERKLLTGGYRCGFYLDIKFKSPVEILFGRGTARIIGEIASPFATGLFYFWLQQATFEALTAWTTLIYPQLFCEEHVGDGYRRNDRASFGGGHIEGVPGLGVEIVDYYDLLNSNAAIAEFPPGSWSVHASWFINPGGHPITNVALGIKDVGRQDYFAIQGTVDAGLPFMLVTEASGYSDDPHTVEAWMQGDMILTAFPRLCTCVTFVVNWTGTSEPNPYSNPIDPFGPIGPRIPPKCSEYD